LFRSPSLGLDEAREGTPFKSIDDNGSGDWIPHVKASKKQFRRRHRAGSFKRDALTMTADSTVPTLGAKRPQDLDGAPSWRE
jgi:hypothetical protein